MLTVVFGLGAVRGFSFDGCNRSVYVCILFITQGTLTQTDRQTDGQRDTHVDRQRERETDRQTDAILACMYVSLR